MSLRLIYGRAGSGKTHFCLYDIKQRLEESSDRPLVLIVPEQFSFQAEASLIKTVGRGGIIRAEVLSFRRLAYRVFNEVGGVTRRHINSAGKCMLIYRILDRMKEEARVFSRAMLQQGFINTLSEAIAEFKRYKLTPEALAEAAARVGGNELLEGKLLELSRVYSAFEETLENRYMDIDDDLTELAGRLEKSDKYKDAEFWLDGFTGFTPQEFAVIEQLLLKACRVNVSLCMEALPGSNISGTDVFAPVKNTAVKLAGIAEASGLTLEAPVHILNQELDRYRTSPGLRHLEQQLFTYPYRAYHNETSDISIFSSVNIFSEVENTAKDIIRLCRDKGFRYRDIAVVSRSLPSYEKLIGAIFEQYGVPFFIDSKRNVADHPLMQLVIAALEIFTSSWSYESVFKYLKTGLTDMKREDIDFLENYVLANGIRGSRWISDDAWSGKLERLGGKITLNEKTIITRAEEIRDGVVNPLVELRNNTKGRRKAKELCTALYEFLCKLGIPEKMEAMIDGFRKAGELDLANEYGQVWNILMEVFDQIVEALGDESTGMERFSRMLAVGIGEYKVGIIPPALDQVLVGSVERSKSHEIKALYIIGANDGMFPAASKDEGILSDNDRENLHALGIELAQDTRARAFEELMLVYMVMTTPSHYLRISYPIADAEGRTMRPSMIISRLHRLFPKVEMSSNIINTDDEESILDEISSPEPTLDRLMSEQRRKCDGFAINPLWEKVLGWYLERQDWSDRCQNALSGLNYTNRVLPIGKNRAGELYGSPLNSSVSRLERFAACPFSYYVEYGLGAAERKMFRLSAPDVGTFVHLAVDEFSKELAEKSMSWRDIDREQCTVMVGRIVDRLLESMKGSVFNSSERYRYLADRLKRVLARTVWLVSEHIRKGSFEPLGYEIAFGEKGGLPPIIIELPDGEKLRLRGRIDRVDALKTENGTYLRIVDYKSGAKAFKLADVYYGLQIQLVTYLDALWENGVEGLPGPILPGGILYFRIDDPLVKGDRSLAEEEVEKAVMKQLKMKGLLLADVRVIREMDRQLEGDSLIIPARINKNGELGRSSAATAEQFQLLRSHARRLLVRLGSEITKGCVDIRPYKKGRASACTYCSYHSVCQFDTTIADNKYRFVREMKDDDVWPLIRQEEGGGFND